jgi:hypothetical protein
MKGPRSRVASATLQTAGWQRVARASSEPSAEPVHAQPVRFLASVAFSTVATAANYDEGAAGQRVKQLLTPTREVR